MTVYIDVQHMGDPVKKGRMGAAFGEDINQTEAYYTSLYAFWMGMYLRQRGHEVINISDGQYKDRHARVNYYDERNRNSDTPSVYIACHLNAGGGSYAAQFYDSRSATGKILANLMNEGLLNLPQIQSVKSIPCHNEDWTKNAFYCIKRIGYPVAICCEPLFIDHPPHKELLTVDGMKKLGEAMALGIHNFLELQ
tara:strand:- start:12287 stop:12871 length:585 start_codon:yes stop_codon:yes gene_type:complete